MYADKVTQSMQQTINETNRRREKQLAYNEKHNITPRQVIKSNRAILSGEELKPIATYYAEPADVSVAADPVLQYMSIPQLQKAISREKNAMEAAAKELDFIAAAAHRDEMHALQNLLKTRENT